MTHSSLEEKSKSVCLSALLFFFQKFTIRFEADDWSAQTPFLIESTTLAKDVFTHTTRAYHRSACIQEPLEIFTHATRHGVLLWIHCAKDLECMTEALLELYVAQALVLE